MRLARRWVGPLQRNWAVAAYVGVYLATPFDTNKISCLLGGPARFGGVCRPKAAHAGVGSEAAGRAVAARARAVRTAGAGAARSCAAGHAARA
eukprot:scaffold57518_cov64-Phaeocystis_antarctica.AAC.2